MSTDDLTGNPTLSAPIRSGGDAYARIADLARSCNRRVRFLTDALKVLVGRFQSPYGAVHARYGAEVLHDEWHTGPTDPGFWKGSVQSFLTDCLAETGAKAKLLKSRSGDARVAYLSAPLFDAAGSSVGAVALVATNLEEAPIEAMLAELEALCKLISFCSERVESVRPEAQSQRVSDRVLARAGVCESVEQFAFIITNELRNRLSCAQVALGLARGQHVRVVSISGLDHVNRSSPGVTAMRAAMEECLDAGEPIVFQSAGTWASDAEATSHFLHKKWHQSARGDAVASIPLWIGDDIIAVLAFRRRADEPFSRETITDLQSRTEPLAPALQLTVRANRSLGAHARDRSTSVLEKLLGRGHVKLKLSVVAAMLLAGFVALGRLDYAVTAPARVIPAQARHISAPIEGVLATAHVLPGDIVRAGQVLATFDTRELEREAQSLEAELSVFEKMRDRAMSQNAPPEAAVAEANAELVRRKLSAVQQRIARATVTAPFDAVVVGGDLRSAVGSVLALGQPLYELAREDDWMLEIELPEHALDDARGASTGSFSSFASPKDRHAVEIERVRPAAERRQNRIVFVAEARLAHAEGFVRPGMEGVVSLASGRRPVWWILSHRAVEYLRAHFWL